MREAKPWFRKSTKTWYVQLDGRQVPLGKDKQQANRKYHQLMTGRRNGHTIHRVDELLDEYLEHVKHNQAASSYRLYKHYFRSFNKTIANKRVHDLCPHDVQRWLDSMGWNPTTRKIAAKTIKAAFNWGVRGGLIPSSPLVGLRMPAGLSRDVLITPAQWEQIAGAVEGEFRDLLIFLRESGARPQEARALEAAHIRDDHIMLSKVDSKGKRYNRMIYLTDAAEAIIKRLSIKHPEGKLFRNQRGHPWSGTALTHKCSELGKKLGFPFFPYALRHTWITEALERGEDALTVAILAGHRDTTMVAKVYSHLNRKPDYLRAAAKRARGA